MKESDSGKTQFVSEDVIESQRRLGSDQLENVRLSSKIWLEGGREALELGEAKMLLLNAMNHWMNAAYGKSEECEQLKSERDQLQQRVAVLEDFFVSIPARVVAMCKKRGWSMHWTHRGAYLHLESSELIEAIRGKHGDPIEEAGDVLLVLMSITEYAGISFHDIVAKAKTKLTNLETAPHYPGEEYSESGGTTPERLG